MVIHTTVAMLFLEDWLLCINGVKSKTWSMLISCLRNLGSVTWSIEEKLLNEGLIYRSSGTV